MPHVFSLEGAEVGSLPLAREVRGASDSSAGRVVLVLTAALTVTGVVGGLVVQALRRRK